MTDDARFWITTAVATVALILSVVNSYNQWRTTKPRLLVNAIIRPAAIPLPTADGIGPREVPCLVIHLANPTDKPVYVKQVLFQSAGREAVELGEHHAGYGELTRPFTVDPWGGQDLHVRGKTLLEKLHVTSVPTQIRATVVVLDELRTSYRSRPFQFSSADLDELRILPKTSAT
jgi:hypothetical protein